MEHRLTLVVQGGKAIERARKDAAAARAKADKAEVKSKSEDAAHEAQLARHKAETALGDVRRLWHAPIFTRCLRLWARA
jgi:hypothetical protein